MLFDSVNHVAIIASDLEKSIDFYVNKLGLKQFDRIDRPERKSSIIYLNAGNCIVELFSFPDPPKRLSYPEAAGLRHLAFSVPNFDEVIAKLEEMEIDYVPIQDDARTGKRMTFIFDPDQLPIELSEV
jgi:glyoxylase I family protein